MMTLHKLTAGDGYTYLTRQVAVADSTERGYSLVGRLLRREGGVPGAVGRAGVWSPSAPPGWSPSSRCGTCSGWASTRTRERIQADLVAQGWSVPAAAAEARLGSAFPIYRGPRASGTNGWRSAYGEWNQVHGHPERARIPEEDRARIRTELARAMFVEQHHRDPRHRAGADRVPARRCPGRRGRRSPGST